MNQWGLQFQNHLTLRSGLGCKNFFLQFPLQSWENLGMCLESKWTTQEPHQTGLRTRLETAALRMSSGSLLWPAEAWPGFRGPGQ